MPPVANPALAGVQEDLVHWLDWWRDERERWMRRPSSAVSAADRAEIARALMTALQRALADPSRDQDLVRACVLALAQVGGPGALDCILARFDDADVQVRRTAALALGVRGDAAALARLIADLERATDGSGQRARGTARHSCYALGLLARAGEPWVVAAVCKALARVLVVSTEVDLRVAALRGLRIAGAHARPQIHHTVRAQLRRLVFARGNEVVRANACTALAAMVGAGSAALGPRIARELCDRSSPHRLLQVSTALALGRLPRSDAGVARLRQLVRAGASERARRFASLSLGRVGDADDRAWLLAELERAPPSQRPWVAFGLALFNARTRSREAPIDRGVARALHARFRAESDPFTKAGLALALGLMKDRTAGEEIIAAMRAAGRGPAAGACALALGLMGYRPARLPIRTLLQQAWDRLGIAGRAGDALSLLGDRDLVSLCLEPLHSASTARLCTACRVLSVSRAAAAVPPLLDLIRDAKARPLARALAAEALGALCDNGRRWDTSLVTGEGGGLSGW